MPEITENPEIPKSCFAYVLLPFCFYYSLPLLFPSSIVLIVYCSVSYNREYRSTRTIVISLIVPTLIVSSSYCARLLYCP